MKVGSLFSGIGGLDLGLEWAGMKVVWQVENDPYCQKVLRRHWPHVELYGDIREIDFRNVEPVDLICGGFPCQPVSCAGKRKGDADDRWLWPEFYRAVCEAKPRWVLVENVPGLLSAQNGRLFGGILRDLARCGYDAEWELLPAAAFGAPHLRCRLFLVAYHQERENHVRNTGSLEQETKSGEGGNSSLGIGGQVVANSNSTIGITEGGASQKILGQETEQRFRRCGSGGCQGDVPDSGQPGLPEPEQKTVFGAGRGDEGRAITKCDWWDSEPDVGRVAHGVPSRVHRLKALGNAVVPQVAEWIGRRILDADRGSAV